MTDNGKIETGNIEEKIKKIERFSGDSFWKNLLDDYFYPFLKRALPELYADADTETEPVFLNIEFTDVLKTTDPKKHKNSRFADLLIDVPLKNGTAKCVLLHIEAQSSGGGGDLAERMYFYQCFIYAHYRREVVAIAIIAGKRPKNESRRYRRSNYGTIVDYDYNNLVLSELDDEDLMTSGNPIDIVLYAAKYAAKTKAQLQRYNYLRTATRLLAELGWNMDEKYAFLHFVQRIINLKDEKLKAEYFEYLEQLDREGKIVYVTMAEEYYTKKGVEKGKLEVARNLLANGVSPDIIAKSADLPIDKVKELMN
jgi:hypothetical protein